MRIKALLFFLSLFPLFASDFNECQKVLTQSFKISDNHHTVYTAYGWLAFSETPIDPKLVKKENRLLGLYLLKEGKGKKVLKVYNRFPKEIALITPYSIRPNKIVSEAYGIEKLARLRNDIDAPFAVMGACCTLRGFNSGNGVVTADYILSFLNTKDTRFATAGVRFRQTKKGIVVAEKNPFIKYNPLQIGDRVLFYNKKKVTLYELEKRLLLSKPGSKHFFLIERKGREERVKVTLKTRLGGGVLADTFLEHLGMQFNEKLEIVAIEKGSIVDSLELMPNDRLVSLDGKLFKDDKKLRSYLSTAALPKEKMKLLIERKGLQFFVYIPRSMLIKTK